MRPKIIGLVDVANKATKDDVTVSQRHNGGRLHKFSVPFGITQKKACELQKELGYHPLGYGFYSFDATLTETTWCCGDSCD